MKYQEFLESKKVEAKLGGLESVPTLNENLFPFQRDICTWAIRGGQRAIFAAFGLGKTVMQLQCVLAMCRGEHDAGLIVAPLGVRQEFKRDAKELFGVDIQYVRNDAEFAKLYDDGHRMFLTNYERVREGMLDVEQFIAISLDEASVLRSRGSKTYQTFLDGCKKVKYKFVATATPAPNDYREIINYADFLGIMDSGQALTRFFKRNSSKAGDLTLHAHKEEEFWRWVGTWACFVQYPSDLGYRDDGYVLPKLEMGKNIIVHRLDVDHKEAGFDGWGQGKIFCDKAVGLSGQSKERRRSLGQRCQMAIELIEGSPEDHFAIWCELNDEAKVIEAYLKEKFGKDAYVTAHGVTKPSDIDRRENDLVKFADGLVQFIVTKPSVTGSGCNFQRHCHRGLYLGVTDKFNDFIQSIHRIYRFMQKGDVRFDLIFTANQDRTYDNMMRKWGQYDELNENMRGIIKKYGLNIGIDDVARRSMNVERMEAKGDRFTCVHNDSILEFRGMADDSVDLFVTSWPFSDQYEYTPNYRDFGHNDGDDYFFAQMDFLTPETYRVLKPGRVYALHVKDRIVFGYQSPFGRQSPIGRYSVNPFSDKCVSHMIKHGFIYNGRITVDTDVVRENSQTNRLTRSERRKDGTKMGVGMPEYILLFFKPQSNTQKGYADVPVVDLEVDNDSWQLDASPIWRSDGAYRFLPPEKIRSLSLPALKSLWKKHCKANDYIYDEHVFVNSILANTYDEVEVKGKKVNISRLPGSFQLLPPYCHNEAWIWEDVVRMQTLNCKQSKGRKELHTCPLQFDVVERLIKWFSNEGELVADPFGGIMTVPYCAVKLDRKGLGVELNPDYYADGVLHCRAIEHKKTMPTFWDLAEFEKEEEAAMAA